MNADEFRKIALSFPEASEASHMHHPDFRVGGKIFATLGYPDKNWAVVKFTPDQQRDFVSRDPDVFAPVKGGWGRGGSTNLYLPKTKRAAVQKALAVARGNVASQSVRSQHSKA